MKNEWLNNVILDDKTVGEINVLKNHADETFTSALKNLQNLAVIRDHLNDKLHKALLKWAIANNITVDINDLPLLFCQLAFNSGQGVVVGFTQREHTSILPDGKIRINDLKPMMVKETKSGDK